MTNLKLVSALVAMAFAASVGTSLAAEKAAPAGDKPAMTDGAKDKAADTSTDVKPGHKKHKKRKKHSS
jgi:Ni/Co efflux regulator RcnB